jgi:hypothetical protein
MRNKIAQNFGCQQKDLKHSMTCRLSINDWFHEEKETFSWRAFFS